MSIKRLLFCLLSICAIATQAMEQPAKKQKFDLSSIVDPKLKKNIDLLQKMEDKPDFVENDLLKEIVLKAVTDLEATLADQKFITNQGPELINNLNKLHASIKALFKNPKSLFEQASNKVKTELFTSKENFNNFLDMALQQEHAIFRLILPTIIESDDFKKELLNQCKVREFSYQMETAPVVFWSENNEKKLMQDKNIIYLVNFKNAKTIIKDLQKMLDCYLTAENITNVKHITFVEIIGTNRELTKIVFKIKTSSETDVFGFDLEKDTLVKIKFPTHIIPERSFWGNINQVYGFPSGDVLIHNTFSNKDLLIRSNPICKRLKFLRLSPDEKSLFIAYDDGVSKNSFIIYDIEKENKTELFFPNADTILSNTVIDSYSVYWAKDKFYINFCSKDQANNQRKLHLTSWTIDSLKLCESTHQNLCYDADTINSSQSIATVSHPLNYFYFLSIASNTIKTGKSIPISDVSKFFTSIPSNLLISESFNQNFVPGSSIKPVSVKFVVYDLSKLFKLLYNYDFSTKVITKDRNVTNLLNEVLKKLKEKENLPTFKFAS